MKKMLCTTYNQTKRGLVLRGYWIQDYSEEDLSKWGIHSTLFFNEPDKGISEILEGTMDYSDIIIHIRIIKY